MGREPMNGTYILACFGVAGIWLLAIAILVLAYVTFQFAPDAIAAAEGIARGLMASQGVSV